MTRKCIRCGSTEQMFSAVDYCRLCLEIAAVEMRREERARLREVSRARARR